MQETPETLMGITAALLESLLSPLELASKVEQAVQETIEAVRQTLGTECSMGKRCTTSWNRCDFNFSTEAFIGSSNVFSFENSPIRVPQLNFVC